ncbi:MAG: tetratricopeptide repeat protein [Planctomycetes bacterium]|nr:tetratricopeptide repeat protein [Planctomycetota bacterium]
MRESISCPACNRTLLLPEEVVGCDVQCPACLTVFTAGAQAASTPLGLEALQSEALVSEAPDDSTPLDEHERDERASEREAQRPERPIRRRYRRDSDDDDSDDDHRHDPDRDDDDFKLPRAPRAVAPPKKSKAGRIVLFSILGILAVVRVLISFQRDDRPPRGQAPLPPPVVWQFPVNRDEDDEARRREIMEAFRNQKPLAEDEIARELKPLFENLGAAFKQGDPERLVAQFDMDRLLDQIVALGVLPQNAVRNRQQFVQGMRQGMAQANARNPFLQNPAFQWDATEIRNIKKLVGNEAVVIVRHTAPGGFPMKLRWWVTKQTGTWKVFDFEDLDTGIRMSAAAATTVQMGPANAFMIAEHAKVLAAASQALQRNDLESAERNLARLDGAQLPPLFESLRLFVRAGLHLQGGRFEDALKSVDQALAKNPDMPAADLIKAVAFNRLGKYVQALDHLTKYRELLGEDDVVCAELGEALRGLNRFDEAIANYRKALDFNPKDADAFLGYIRALGPNDAREDVGPRFLKLDNLPANFDICANDCRQARDGKTLEVLARAMLKIDPRHEQASLCMMLGKVWAGQTKEAMRLFKSALKKVKNADRRRELLDATLPAFAQAGKAVDAYRILPNATEGFAVLATELHKSFLFEDLESLTALHAKKHPADPWLPFFEAEVHVQNGDYELAEKAFQKGLAKPPPGLQVELFRRGRITTRHHLAGAVAAYKEFGPGRDVFQQLALSASLEENDDQLAELVEEHTKSEAQDPELLRYQLKLAIQRNKLADAAALLKKALKRERDKDGRLNALEDFCFALVDGGKALDGYRAVDDPKRIFQVLAGDLLSQGHKKDLKQLLDAHRLKFPEDPWVAYYTAEMFVDENAWEKAAQALTQWWTKAPRDQRRSQRTNYVHALYKAGRAMEAYATGEPQNETFTQLANLMIADKKAPQLRELLATHRPGGAGDDPEMLFLESLFHVIGEKPALAEAEPLLRNACAKQKQQYRREDYVRRFVLSLADVGQALEAYQAAPEKSAAFDALARELVQKKKPAELEKLLVAHRKNQPDDPRDLFYSGELGLLRGDAAEAEKDFAIALAKAASVDQWLYRNKLFRARVQAHKAAETYREFGPGKRTFEDLAFACVDTKEAGQLEALLAEQRQEDNGASNGAWDLDLCWLKNDYQGALALLEKRKTFFSQLRFRVRADDYLIRCLAKLNRTDEAVKEAEALLAKKRIQPALVVLAHAAHGGVDEAIAAVERFATGRFQLEGCYAHAELGPMLRSEPFRTFRDRFPEPKTTFREDFDRD